MATSQASLADGGSGNRWDYTPNTWKDQTPAKHGRYLNQAPVSAVQPGSMPTSNMLGLSPALLSKPAPPPVQINPSFASLAAKPVVAAKMMNAAPKLMPTPTVPVAFNAKFGAPISPIAPPVVASLPQQSPQGLAAKPSASPAKPNSHATTATAIHWRSKPRPIGQSAAAATPIASYGNNAAYRSGGFTQVVSSSSGMNTNTAVMGVIVGNHKR